MNEQDTSIASTSTSGPEVTRRTVAKGAAWSIPAITMAVATPASASSPEPAVCKDVRAHTGLRNRWYFSSLGSGNRWRDKSVLTVTFEVGSSSSGKGGLAYSSDGSGIIVTTTSFARAIVQPVRIKWTTVPKGWSFTETHLGGTTYRYEVTPDSIPTVGALTPAGTRPPGNSSLNAVPLTTFKGHATQVPWKKGQSINGTYVFPTSKTLLYSAIHPDSRCGTEVINGSETSQLTLTHGD